MHKSRAVLLKTVLKLHYNYNTHRLTAYSFVAAAARAAATAAAAAAGDDDDGDE
jgi:hypothetical protein